MKWNPEAENLILSTSADCYAVVITLDLAQLDESSTSKNGAIGYSSIFVIHSNRLKKKEKYNYLSWTDLFS